MANFDLQNRSPKVERLPDQRLRVTRFGDVLNNVPKTPAGIAEAGLWLDWGTPDADYPNCRLIHQDFSGQEGEFLKPCDEPPKLVRVYEEIPANDEIVVGNPSISYDQYGNKTAVLDYLQFSAGTSVYTYVVGTTLAPAPNNDCFLKISEATNDGTLIRTKRTFINRGELSDTEQLKFGGHLLLRELTYLNQIPPTPTGWQLVTKSTEFIAGLPVYRYGFANGGGGGGGAGGVISTETVYNRSPDQGATGVTVTTIKYISDTSVSSNPITGPAGSELISVEYDDQDGYRLWTAIYASGQGVVSSTVETKNSGRLIVYSKTSINSPPSQPSATIGGTVVLIRADVSNGTRVEDGTVVYDYTWVEGFGLVEFDHEYRYNGELVIYKLTSFGIAPTPPSQTIGGSVVLITANQRKVDGYTVYDYVYAEGIGTIDSTVETKNNGNLIIYRITSIGSSPATPTPTIGGTVSLISAGTKQADGYQVFDYVWAEGSGQISSSVETREGGKLIIYSIVSFGIEPTEPSPTIGGTVTSISKDIRQADGYPIYDYKWAEGFGEVGRSTEYIQSSNAGVTGITRVTIRTLTAIGDPEPTSNPGSGFVKMSVSSTNQDGYILWSTGWAKGTGPVSSETSTREGGKLIIYHVVAIGAAPSTPAATIGGIVTLINQGTTQSDGYTIYDYTWAEGNGEISREVRYEQSVDQGTNGLTITTIRYLTNLISIFNPITPPVLSVNIGESHVNQDGYQIWTGTYARGDGKVDTHKETRSDGSTVTTVTELSSTSDTPDGPFGSYLVSLDNTISSGHYINRATYITPPATRVFRKTIKNWQMPGFAYFDGTQLVLQPPTTRDILGSIEVSYDIAQVTTSPFEVKKWASFFYSYTTTETAQVPSQTVNGSQGLTGYLAEGGTTFGTNSDYNGVLCDTYSATKVASEPTSLPSGDTVIDVDNDPYLISLSGQTVYKRTVTSVNL